MASEPSTPRSFKLEGNAAGLRCLMETIDAALRRTEQDSQPAVAERKVGQLDIEVRVSDAAVVLSVRPSSREEAAIMLEGWAENVKCANCEIPVALLFEEEYLESSTGRGAVCASCMEEELDDESS
jgi:hypothetical protein